jgi:hypothetical protein
MDPLKTPWTVGSGDDDEMEPALHSYKQTDRLTLIPRQP